MQNNNSQSDNLTFRISSGLKDIIGRDLIFDANIAVFELVKNSFDARAKRVDIIFDTNKIVIKDNGKGMTYNDLINKWLFVAYSAKKQGTEDDDENVKENYRNKIRPKKFYAGAKGIGRFSCDRLGSKLRLITKSEKPNSKVEQIEVNWEDFQNNPNKDFIKIPVKYSNPQFIEYDDFESGTILEITNLRSIWNHKEVLKLKRSLEKLINPFGSNANDINAFDINIKAIYLKPQDKIELQKYIKENHTDKEGKYCQNIVNGKIQNFVFETLNVKTTQIYTQIEESGKYIITELIDRGVLIFRIREKNPYEHLRNIHFRLFFLNTVAKKNFGLKMKMTVVNFGSIFLFKNGFRVLPYGEPEDDSFGIDRRKSQGYSRYLGTRELLGKIDIIGNNNEFRETSSRSGGLIQTKGFDELVISFMEHCLKRLEKYVVDVQWAKATYRDLDKKSPNISALNNIEAKALIINVISKIIKGKDVELLDYDKEFLNILDEKLQNIVPDVFSDLEQIAEKTNDERFLNEIKKVEERYVKLQKELEEAEQARIEAEERAIKEAEAKRIAEEKAKREEEARIRADNKRLKAEAAKIKAENERLKAVEAKRVAEGKTKEAEAAKKIAELQQLKEANAREKAEAESVLQKKLRIKQEKYFASLSTLDFDTTINLIHQIGSTGETIKNSIDFMLMSYRKKKKIDRLSIIDDLEIIQLEAQKIISVSNFAIKAGFNLASEDVTVNLIAFIKQYIENVSNIHSSSIEIKTKGFDTSAFMKIVKPIEITILIDNIITNSIKSGAHNLIVKFKRISDEEVEFSFTDDGKGIEKHLDLQSIFERGVSTTRGAGLGLYHIKQIIGTLGGNVIVKSSPQKGFNLLITIKK